MARLGAQYGLAAQFEHLVIPGLCRTYRAVEGDTASLTPPPLFLPHIPDGFLSTLGSAVCWLLIVGMLACALRVAQRDLDERLVGYQIYRLGAGRTAAIETPATAVAAWLSIMPAAFVTTLLLAPFDSGHPDGLERVAELPSFAGSANDATYALLPDSLCPS